MNQPETGPEHYAEAQRLLRFAQDVLDVEPVGLMSDYPSEDDYFTAIDESLEAHHSAEQTSLVYSGLAQVHATLALAYATAMQDGIRNGWVSSPVGPTDRRCHLVHGHDSHGEHTWTDVDGNWLWCPGSSGTHARQRQAHRIKGCCNGDGGPNCQPPHPGGAS